MGCSNIKRRFSRITFCTPLFVVSLTCHATAAQEASEPCKSQTEVLIASGGVFDDEFRASFNNTQSTCSTTGIGLYSQTICNANYINSTGISLDAKCRAAGGQLLEQDWTYRCEAVPNGVTVLSSTYENLPNCVGETCGAQDYPRLRNPGLGLDDGASEVVTCELVLTRTESLEGAAAPPTFTAITDDNIDDAVSLWVTDGDQALRTYGHISGWDTSQVTHMFGLFNWLAFNDDISGWNTSRVTNMGSMFYRNEVFNRDISGWDVSEVTYMAFMFAETRAFNAPIGSWNVAKVERFDSMFLHAGAFNQNVSGWNVESAISMSKLFLNANSFNQTVCWELPTSLPLDGLEDMFCGSSLGKFDPRCVAARAKEASECPDEPDSSAPPPNIDITDDMQPAIDEDDYVSASAEDTLCESKYRDVPGWLYCAGVGALVLSAVSSLALLFRINLQGQRRWVVLSEAVVRFISDVNMVLVMILAVNTAFLEETSECNGRLATQQFLYSTAIFVVDVSLDWNALLFSLWYKVGSHTYESARWEGLERLHGLSLAVPLTIVWGTVLGGLFFAAPGSFEREWLAWTALGLVVAGGLAGFFLAPMIYGSRYVPGFTAWKFLWSNCGCGGFQFTRDLCNMYMFRNGTNVPRYGPRWGFWFSLGDSWLKPLVAVGEIFLNYEQGLIAFVPPVVLFVTSMLRLGLPFIGDGDIEDFE